MEQIKQAFQKVKQDMAFLSQEIESLKINIAELNWTIFKLGEELKSLKKPFQKTQITPKILKKEHIKTSTHKPSIQTPSTHSSTHDDGFEALKTQILSISTGNEGVPADRQTNRQTNRHIEKELKTSLQHLQTPPQNIKQDAQINQAQLMPVQSPIPQEQKIQDPIQDAAHILDSLDTLKKEIRLKFKRLTEKETLVFSTLYQIDEQGEHADYKTLAQKLNLTESSIRDYISRLISKGIPVEKHKINNKTIQLRVSSSLKKVASLATILQLREL